MKKFLLLALAATSLATPAFAQSLSMRHSPRLMQGIRPQGMGGAFSAVDSADENTLFYNPAGINDFEKKVHMQFGLPTAEFSLKAIPFLASDIPGLADDIDAQSTDGGKISVFDAFAATNNGRYEEVGVRGNLVSFMHKFLAASLLYDNRSIVGLTNPASSTIDIESVTHVGLQLGSALSFFNDMLQAGVAVKFLGRHIIDETITQREILANNDFGDIIDTDNFGFGVGVDLGLKAKLPIKGKVWEALDPRFAITLQDVGHTRFTNNTGRINESLTAGLAINPKFGKFKSTLALDIRDLDRQTDFIQKSHIGYELTLTEIGKVLNNASVRVGLNQGYITGGLGFDFRYFKINAATWGREIAERTAYQKQSRIFGLQLAAGF